MNYLDGCSNCKDGCVVCDSDFKSRLEEAEREIEIVSGALKASQAMQRLQEIQQERYEKDVEFIKKELLQALEQCRVSFDFYDKKVEAKFCKEVIERFK